MNKLIKWLFSRSTARQIKFDKARKAKSKRELIEDGKRDAVDHPKV